MVMTDYLGALTVLTPCIATYREDNWPSLTYSVLSSSLKCAFLSAELKTYAALCLELSGLNCNGAAWLEEEKKRVWSNFLQVLDTGKAPLPEPSLTAKNERASVGNATKAWTQLLRSLILWQFKSPSKRINLCRLRHRVEFRVFLSVNVIGDRTFCKRIADLIHHIGFTN